MDREHYDYLFKFIIIGNSNTGKSSLLYHFLETKRGSTHTIGVEFGSKFLRSDNKSLKLQIWDTAGQERYRSVTKTYYRGALGAIIVYDITSAESFASVHQWLQDAKEFSKSDIACILVGNKSDLKAERQVDAGEAADFAQDNNMIFMEVSALTGENVEEVFKVLSKTILSKIKDGKGRGFIENKGELGAIDAGDLKPKVSRSLTTTTGDKEKSRCYPCS